MVLAVGGQHLLLTPRQALLLRLARLVRERGMCRLPRHGPFKLGVGGTELIFVGAVVSPQPIGGRSMLNGIDDPQVCREGKHFGFGEVRDGRKVHTAVPVLGVEPDPKVFDFVARAGDECAGALPQRIQCGHAQPGPSVRHGQALALVGAVGQGPCKRVVHLRQRNR